MLCTCKHTCIKYYVFSIFEKRCNNWIDHHGGGWLNSLIYIFSKRLSIYEHALSDGLVLFSVCPYMSSSMITIQRQDVPEYLQNSGYFLNVFQGLDFERGSDEQAIDVPSDCFKRSPDVTSVNDLKFLLRTIRFWLAPEFLEFSNDIFAFVLGHTSAILDLLPEFGDDFPFLKILHDVISPKDNLQILENAVKEGMLPLIKYLHTTKLALVGSCLTFTSLAAIHGRVDCLAYGLENGSFLSGDECTIAARRGHVQAFKFATENGCKVNLETFVLVASQDLLELVVYLHSKGVQWNSDVTKAAIQHDSLRSLQYLVKHNCPLPERAVTLATKFRSFECLMFLHEELKEPVTIMTVNSAASAGHLNYLVYAYKQGVNGDSSSCEKAASSGHLECLQYLHGHGVALTDTVVSAACRSKQSHCLEFAISVGCFVSDDACVIAAKYGSVECLKCLRAHGAAVTTKAAIAAATAGHDACLIFILDNGVSIDESFCITIADLCNLDCLKFLHERGAVITEGVVIACVRAQNRRFEAHMHQREAQKRISDAFKVGKMQCILYALQHITTVLSPAVCAAAAARRDLWILKLLHEHGAQWDASTSLAAIEYNALDCLKYAVENSCPMDVTVASEAARKGDVDLLIWLRAAGCPCDTSIITAAVERDQYVVLNYALYNGFPDAEVPAEVLAKAPRCNAILSRHQQRLRKRQQMETEGYKRKADDQLGPGH